MEKIDENLALIRNTFLSCHYFIPHMLVVATAAATLDGAQASQPHLLTYLLESVLSECVRVAAGKVKKCWKPSASKPTQIHAQTPKETKQKSGGAER